MSATAVVTGGAGGLGQAFTRRLCAGGSEVVPVDVTGDVRRLDVTGPAARRARRNRVAEAARQGGRP